MLRFAFTLLVCTSSPALAFQTVHVVQGGGAALQTAIGNAVDGDTLLVRAGNYVGCSIDGKGLSVVSDAPGSTVVDTVRIANTGLGQKILISGFHVRTPALTAAPAAPSCVVLTNCADSVRLEALTNEIFTPHSTPAVFVQNCSDVALARCMLTGSNGTSVTGDLSFTAVQPGAGLSASGSQVAAHDSTLRGGDGNDGFYYTQQIPFFPFPPTLGAPGADVLAGATLSSNGSLLRGGQGGNGLPGHCSPTTGLPVAGGAALNGGDGLRTVAGGQSFVLGTTLQAGAGGLGIGGAICSGFPAPAGASGAPGNASSGPLTTFPGTAGTLAGPTRVRSGQPIALTVTGAPGDVVFLALSLQARWDLNPFYEGVFLFGPSARRSVLGIIPGSGALGVSMPSEALPAGVFARHRHLQVLTRDPSGALQLGSFGVVTILDPSL